MATRVIPAARRARRDRTGSLPASRSLSARVMLASSLLAVLVAGVFILLAFTISDLGAAADRESRAKDVIVDTVVLGALVSDLESGQQGFAITGKKRFLKPWQQAKSELPRALAEFRREAGDDPARRLAAREVSDQIIAYRDEYSKNLVKIARYCPSCAVTQTARDEGRLRTDQIRRGLDAILRDERRGAASTAAAAHDEARRATYLGFGGVVASVVMILLLGLYLTRSIARPVRDVATEARRIARGDLAVRLDERGPGEVGSLKRAFRAMAADLAERQRALEEQNARLRESERLKSDLVSIVSHEIRTPLASILGFTSVLLERDVRPADRTRFLEIIGAEARRLTALLDEFLDVQRFEDGPFELSWGEVDVSSLVRTQAALFSAESAKHRLKLQLPDEPLVVEGDAGRLAQVISNLMSNAIKFSPEGGDVEVSGEQDNGIVRIHVRDEGFGIPQEVRDRLFTKFFRGTAPEQGIAGSGLGLALARLVVEAHGGTIDFDSTVGEGTTFSVELPKSPDAPVGQAGERRGHA